MIARRRLAQRLNSEEIITAIQRVNAIEGPLRIGNDDSLSKPRQRDSMATSSERRHSGKRS